MVSTSLLRSLQDAPKQYGAVRCECRSIPFHIAVIAMTIPHKIQKKNYSLSSRIISDWPIVIIILPEGVNRGKKAGGGYRNDRSFFFSFFIQIFLVGEIGVRALTRQEIWNWRKKQEDQNICVHSWGRDLFLLPFLLHNAGAWTVIIPHIHHPEPENKS